MNNKYEVINPEKVEQIRTEILRRIIGQECNISCNCGCWKTGQAKVVDLRAPKNDYNYSMAWTVVVKSGSHQSQTSLGFFMQAEELIEIIDSII